MTASEEPTKINGSMLCNHRSVICISNRIRTCACRGRRVRADSQGRGTEKWSLKNEFNKRKHQDTVTSHSCGCDLSSSDSGATCRGELQTGAAAALRSSSAVITLSASGRRKSPRREATEATSRVAQLSQSTDFVITGTHVHTT